MTTHIQQARTSRYCGQACLAMLAGVDLELAVTIVGHRRATKKRDILKFARKLGLIPKSSLWTLARDMESLPVKALVQARHKWRRTYHWCCFVDGQYHDPLQSNAGEVGRNSEWICWMEFHTPRKP